MGLEAPTGGAAGDATGRRIRRRSLGPNASAARLDVVGLGLAIVDVVLRVERMPAWEDPRGLLDFALADGGPAGTACFVASTFGLRTGFVDTVGDDDLGEHRRRSLEKAGVDTSRLVPRDGPEDHVVVVYVDAATGERVFSFRRGFLSRPLAVDDLDRKYIESARILHLDGSHSEAALAAARWTKRAGGTVVLDAAATSHKVLEPARALVAETDVLICGAGFAPMLTGEEDVWRAGRAALELGPSVVVQTEGARGSYTVSRRRGARGPGARRTGTRRTGATGTGAGDAEFHTPAFDVDVVDTTGAGDTFHGAYLVGLARGWSLEHCASFSSAVAALHCTVLGNRKGIPSMAEVEALMAAQPATAAIGLRVPSAAQHGNATGRQARRSDSGNADDGEATPATGAPGAA